MFGTGHKMKMGTCRNMDHKHIMYAKINEQKASVLVGISNLDRINWPPATGL
jgi:hypothetical protein